ncbi:MAG: AAA family ATPase [Chloroflexi bacterium]|nr:AAA family ATPase [Chloroflexota bacterium]
MSGVALFHGHDFPRALNRLGRRYEIQTLETIRRLGVGDRRGGLNDELLHRYASGLEIRSARVTQAYRLIFARADERVVVLWVDNHDEAYAWADRHRGDIPRRFEVLERPEPAPNVQSQDPFPVRDPDELDELAARGYEYYFSALDEQQRFLVEFDAAKSNRRGLSFVTAGAGTGKTSIAIHRALHRAAQPDLEGGRVLYLCYNRALMLSVRRTIDLLARPEVARQIEANTFHGWAERYLQRRGAAYSVAKNVDIFGDWMRSAIPEERQELPAGAREVIGDLTDDVLRNEIERVLSPNQFDGIAPYLNLTRPESQGLRRLRRPQREAIWELHRRVRKRDDALDGWEDLIERARAARVADPDPPQYRDVIVDEGQDCSPVMARLAKALVAGAEQRLLILADPAQSLYPGRFLWARREFGPRGRQALTLRQPYRSTRQIHALAASLYDGVDEKRREIGEMTKAERQGPLPRLARFVTEQEGLDVVVEWIQAELVRGRPAGQIALLAGRNRRRDEVRTALEQAGVPVHTVDRDSPPDGASVSLATVHAAKGLDFPSVYLLDPVLDVIPMDSRRAQFYVALTRSSRNLSIVCCADARSPLLDDLDPACYQRVGPPAA